MSREEKLNILKEKSEQKEKIINIKTLDEQSINWTNRDTVQEQFDLIIAEKVYIFGMKVSYQ